MGEPIHEMLERYKLIEATIQQIADLRLELENSKPSGEGGLASADVWAFVSYYDLVHGFQGDPVVRHQKKIDDLIEKLVELGLKRDDILKRTQPQPAYLYYNRFDQR